MSLTCTAFCRTILIEDKIMSLQSISMSTDLNKRERLELRLPKRTKLLLKQAADIQGRSLSDFLATTAEKAAHEVIRDNQILQLSLQDSLSFAKTILQTSKPNSKLKSAYARYTRDVASQ